MKPLTRRLRQSYAGHGEHFTRRLSANEQGIRGPWTSKGRYGILSDSLSAESRRKDTNGGDGTLDKGTGDPEKAGSWRKNTGTRAYFSTTLRRIIL